MRISPGFALVRIASLRAFIGVVAGTSDPINRVSNARPMHAPVPTCEKRLTAILVLYFMAMMVPPVLDDSANLGAEGDHTLSLLSVLEGSLLVRSVGKFEPFMLLVEVLNVQRMQCPKSDASMP